MTLISFLSKNYPNNVNFIYRKFRRYRQLSYLHPSFLSFVPLSFLFFYIRYNGYLESFSNERPISTFFSLCHAIVEKYGANSLCSLMYISITYDAIHDGFGKSKVHR